MSKLSTIGVLLGVLMMSGCARVHFKPYYASLGEADPAKDTRIHDQYLESREKPLAAQEDIRVLVNTIPEGLALVDNVLTVKEGYHHVIVGRFSVTPDSNRSFKPFRTSWRKYYCYPQVPLTWVTLGLWAVLVPSFYPCFETNSSSKTEVIQEVKKITNAAGGNLAIMSYLGEKDHQEAMGAAGFILRLDPRMRDGGFKTAPQKLTPAQQSI